MLNQPFSSLYTFSVSLTRTPSQRCKGVKLFAVTLFLTNYILAAAMVWVAVCAYYGPPLPETALFLPLANILLLPQLRAAMPGVPDFGSWTTCFRAGSLALTPFANRDIHGSLRVLREHRRSTCMADICLKVHVPNAGLGRFVLLRCSCFSRSSGAALIVTVVPAIPKKCTSTRRFLYTIRKRFQQ